MLIRIIYPAMISSLIMVIVFFNTQNAFSARARIYTGKVKEIELDKGEETGKIIIATEEGDIAFNVTNKTGVKIIDIEEKAMKADTGSILSEEKDGVDYADIAEIESKDGINAIKIVATTTRRMTMTREELGKKAEEILRKNAEVAEKAKLVTENHGTIKGNVRVYARTSGDTIVYIEEVGDNNFIPVQKKHVPEIKASGSVGTKSPGTPREYPVMDQMNITFTPHVLPVLKGSVVDFPNSDTVRHNVFSPDKTPGSEEKLNLGTYPMGITKTVEIPGAGVMDLLCNVHSEMSGYIVSLDNPYFTVTDRKGNFTIENVPPGTYTLKTWHELYESVSMEAKVEAGRVTEIKLPSIKIMKP